MDAKTVSRLVGQMEKDELVALISKLVAYDGDAEQKLLVYCQKRPSPDNMNIVNEKLLIRHWYNAEPIIDDANKYGGCSEDDELEVFGELEEISKLVKTKDISWECRKDVLDGLLAQIDLNNSGFTDSMMEVMENLYSSDEEKKYVADFFAKSSKSNYQKYAASIYRSLGADDQYLAINKANLEYGSDYLNLASYYDERGETDTSMKIVLQGLAKCQGSLDGIYEYLFKRYERKKDEKAIWDLYQKALKVDRGIADLAELIFKYCKNNGNYAGQKQMLLQLMESCHYDMLKKWYKQCQQDFRPDDWQKEEPALFQSIKKRDKTIYLDLCLEKGMKKEVLEYLMTTPVRYSWGFFDNNDRYMKALANEYPDEILQLYWRDVHSLIGMGKEKYYYHAATKLIEIKNIMGQNNRSAEWQKQLAELKEKHNRRRLFLSATEKI